MAKPESPKKQIIMLASLQALFQTASVIIFTLSGVVGLELTNDKSLATLPIAMMMIAAATTMIPASLIMERKGRKYGFFLGTTAGVVGGITASIALAFSSFWLFVIANMFIGCYQGFAQYYRFAAAESAGPEFKSKAISWVTAGGIVAAFAGPNIVNMTLDFGEVRFAGPYICLTVTAISAQLLTAAMTLPSSIQKNIPSLTRPLIQVMRQPTFLTSVLTSSIGYALMILIMTATPIAMLSYGMSFHQASSVIQFHVFAMFIPSLFTGNLVKHYGAIRVIFVGILFMLTHVFISLTGNSYMHFLTGLLFVGIGWNFTFIGATSLLTDSYFKEEQIKSQTAHDFLMFTTICIASLSAGFLLKYWSWEFLNLTALSLLLALSVVLIRFNLTRDR